jgi:hypothetical protein
MGRSSEFIDKTQCIKKKLKMFFSHNWLTEKIGKVEVVL